MSGRCLRPEVRRADRQLQFWEDRLLNTVKEWHRAGSLDRDISCDEAQKLAQELAEHLQEMPTPDPVMPGLIDADWLEDLEESPSWSTAEGLASGSVDIPTTLGPIANDTAVRLLARGYVNSYLMSLLIEGATSNVQLIEPLSRLEERLRSLAT